MSGIPALGAREISELLEAIEARVAQFETEIRVMRRDDYRDAAYQDRLAEKISDREKRIAILKAVTVKVVTEHGPKSGEDDAELQYAIERITNGLNEDNPIPDEMRVRGNKIYVRFPWDGGRPFERERALIVITVERNDDER
jgi:hypothetical protein